MINGNYGQPQQRCTPDDVDRIFNSFDNILDTSRMVYDRFSNQPNGDSRRNTGFGPTPQPQQAYVPSYGYGYYDDIPRQPMMGQSSNGLYPGISNPQYGKG